VLDVRYHGNGLKSWQPRKTNGKDAAAQIFIRRRTGIGLETLAQRADRGR
jgi:hypothetical protein